MIADAASHKTVFARRFQSGFRQVLPALKPTEVCFAIENGLQKGCEHIAARPVFTIGSDAAADISLLDDGVSPVAAELSFEASLFGTLATVRNKGSLLNVDGEPLEPGKSVENCALPLALCVDGVDIQVGLPGRRGARQRSFLDRMLRQATIVMVLCLAVAAIFLALDLFRPAVLTPAPPVPVAETTSTPAPNLRATLVERLADSDLARAVTVSEMPGGGLRAFGLLSEKELAEWRNIQSWFDGITNAPILISNVSKRPILTDIPPIMMVRLSEPKAVILASGEEVGLAREFSNGWRIDTITSETLELSRDDDTFSLSLSQR